MIRAILFFFALLDLSIALPALAADTGRTFRDCAECPEMVIIPAGEFQMGSPAGERNRDSSEGPRHPVTIKAPFALGRTTVTQAQWVAVMGRNPSHFKGDDRPVENVSWNDVQVYLQRLTDRTGRTYRLPSEAEWEYAARAGKATSYPWGNDIGTGNANCEGCGSRWDGRQTAPVQSFDPNRFGLYDMAGNVWQWTDDCWQGDYQAAPADGSARTGRADCPRALRGGSWGNASGFARSAARIRFAQDFRFLTLGFRVRADAPVQ
jgi:formylglycine-generating enzyme required for sulfatase activity